MREEGKEMARHTVDLTTANSGVKTDATREAGVYRMWFPFKRGEYARPPEYDPDGSSAARDVVEPTWTPGWSYEQDGPEDARMVWDGEGEEVRTVVSIHKPGRYPTRVFYTRQWRDPDGKMFGKSGLRMTTLSTFRAWADGRKWAEKRRYERRNKALADSLETFLRLLSENAAVNQASRLTSPQTDSQASGTTP